MKYWLVLIAFLSARAFASIDLIQNPDARDSISLNGQWNAIVDPYDVGDKRKFYENAKQETPDQLLEYNFASAQKLKVPGDWNTQDDKLFFYEGTVWYHKDFTVNKKSGKNYLVHFGAVNYLATVYLNGHEIGTHEGGFTPFQFNVNEQLVDGANSIVVKVNNRREPDFIPTMSTDWWNYGGITRSVKLIELNDSYVDDYSIQYVNGKVPQIKAKVSVKGKVAGAVELHIPELNVRQSLKLNSKGEAQISFNANPRLWTPEAPKLYQTELVYAGETVKDKIGFRYVEVKGDDILLNGQRIFLRGISIHEEKPSGAGRAWSESEDRTLLNWAKELGSNYVRLAHYPHNEKMLRLADEMGLLVWAENPNYWGIQFESDVVLEKAKQQFTEMLVRDKNRASIILWSIANETLNTKDRNHFLSSLAKTVREQDPTRLVTAALNTQTTTEYGHKIEDPLASVVDVIGINSYCGWYYDAPKDCANYKWVTEYKKPIVISEFGGGALHGWHGDENEKYTEENQVAVYKYNLEMFENMAQLRGMSPWILKDFLSPRRPLANVQDYWNRKGLLSESGEKKKAWYIMRDWYAEKAESFK
ncbi:beta-glucuronidase [Catenovulum sp. 2E275]|uniref:glycoside hydrolase family 2 protein n=1 Tax=Catenovulum sp. 2E275 TaxID=2980497 RepID=UPI0021D38F09|nr:glycoside hydrolase family 2 TIM barrel-domain containing protein [Catenovulum sp. 2E275]MCU4676539.1 beta-glucuronidase [Catenovulum sp. 2E275]